MKLRISGTFILPPQLFSCLETGYLAVGRCSFGLRTRPTEKTNLRKNGLAPTRLTVFSTKQQGREENDTVNGLCRQLKVNAMDNLDSVSEYAALRQKLEYLNAGPEPDQAAIAHVISRLEQVQLQIKHEQMGIKGNNPNE